MTCHDVLEELKSLGTAQNRKTYARHGVVGENYGVSYAHLGALKKRIKTNHELAEQLWQSGVHDARVLATMIADPQKVGAGLLDSWVKDVDSYPLGDAVASLAVQTDAARSGVDQWIKSTDELTGSFGWSLMARMTREEAIFHPVELETYLATIERDIRTSKNRVRHSMNSALIAIGCRNPDLQHKAIAAAGRIGKVVVDHGDTDCKTPEAAAYILKTVERASKKKAGKTS